MTIFGQKSSITDQKKVLIRNLKLLSTITRSNVSKKVHVLLYLTLFGTNHLDLPRWLESEAENKKKWKKNTAFNFCKSWPVFFFSIKFFYEFCLRGLDYPIHFSEKTKILHFFFIGCLPHHIKVQKNPMRAFHSLN